MAPGKQGLATSVTAQLRRGHSAGEQMPAGITVIGDGGKPAEV